MAVPTKALASVARSINAQIPRGQRRLHLSAEGEKRRREILHVIVSLMVSATVYQAAYDRRSDDQPVRDRCLEVLIGDALTRPVLAVVVDSRGPARDRRDRLTIARALAGSGRPTYEHRGSRDEPLLALPDAVGWAEGAGRDWRRIVRTITEVRTVVGQRG
ncbi:MAG: hypothetical protein ACKVWR_03300 [Acidimicrobiales bacterium]